MDEIETIRRRVAQRMEQLINSGPIGVISRYRIEYYEHWVVELAKDSDMQRFMFLTGRGTEVGSDGG